MKKIFFAMLLLVTFIFSGCDTKAAINNGTSVGGDLKISMLCIGHGDAILIQTKEQTILIDAANIKNKARFVNELEKLSVTKIDKLILTHPHLDHIGGARIIINPNKANLEELPYLEKISVAEVYDNGVIYGSKSYKGYLKAIQAKGIPYRHLKIGDTLNFGDGATFQVLFPTSELIDTINSGQFDKEDTAYSVNNSSIVGKLTYKNFSMMFTGDCRKESEAKILSYNKFNNLKCDVLKSGHHGSYTSSSKEFVAAINPSCVVISSGDEDADPYTPYVHPNVGVLNTYLSCGVETKNIFCTRWNKTITITSDGKSFSVKPEVEEDWVKKWIAVKREEKKNKKLLKALEQEEKEKEE
ncbi:MAG: MBL fold metallo-hydrolase [Selenomonadaceae bacterium]|nr:MBL fold metallo-hydrolase [Selenomonadaceae bacterium]